jgi:hypothetical protein
MDGRTNSYHSGTGLSRRQDRLDPGFTALERTAERTGSGVSLRYYALDPGSHGVPSGPAHPDRDADGAGAT